MDEALEASRLYDQGKDVEEIRKQIDRQYGRS
jgi:fatty acid-binding protein DegV